MMIHRFLFGTIMSFGLTASAAADNGTVLTCKAAFVSQKHADPAAAERTCVCLAGHLQADKVDEAVGYLLTPGGMYKAFLSDYAYWRANPAAHYWIDECRFIGCAGTASVDDRCDFDAALTAYFRGDRKTEIERY